MSEQHDLRAERSARIAIANVDVIPMSGGEPTLLPNQTLTIEDGTIVDLRPARDVHDTGDGARVIDGSGRFLTPGLIDAHVHFAVTAKELTPIYYGEGDRGVNERLLLLYLLNGVTSVLCLHGSEEILKLRGDVDRGKLLGARIFSSGPIQNSSEMTYDEGRSEAQAQYDAGYDFIKVYSMLSLDGYRGLLDGGREVGLRALGHIPRFVGFDGVLDSELVAVAHAEEFVYTRFQYANSNGQWSTLSAAELPEFAARTGASGVAVIPTLQMFKGIVRQVENLDEWLRAPEMELLPQPVRDAWAPPANLYLRQFPELMHRRRLEEAMWFQTRMVEALHAAGTPIVAGTDALAPAVVPGFSLHAELANLALAGLDTYAALDAATAKAAALLDPARSFGVIEPGARADLVLLNENPLDDIRNTRTIEATMVNGVWRTARELRAALER